MTNSAVFYLGKDVTKETIPLLFKDGFSKAASFEIIDLSKVEDFDSALVALLIEFKKINPALKFTGISADISDLLDLYSVKNWFQA